MKEQHLIAIEDGHARKARTDETQDQATEQVEPSDAEFTRSSTEVAVEPGQYWMAIRPYPLGRVDIGNAHLVMDLVHFEGKLHSIEVLTHPSVHQGGFTMLMRDFFETFQFCPNAEAIREQEQRKIFGAVNDIQAEIMQAQVNPALTEPVVERAVKAWERERDQRAAVTQGAIEQKAANRRAVHKQSDHRAEHVARRRAARRAASGLDHALSDPSADATINAAPKGYYSSSVSAMVQSGINTAGVKTFQDQAERQAVMAQAHAAWLSKKAESIQDVLKQLTPYINERAALAIAKSKGAMDLARNLGESVKSLGLYTGDGVSVVQIREGAEASPDLPLTIFQAKRFMDEELAVFEEVGDDFDCDSKKVFFDSLSKSDELLDQLLPAQRSVASMAVCRRNRFYDNDPFSALMKNLENERVFMLVRNGQNVYAVYSSEPSHEAARRLFPTRDELDEPFHGNRGQITLQDVQFGKAKDAFDNMALLYRRFLILLCGLDHRLELFGDFYPREHAMDFMAPWFQEEYFHFVVDDDASVLIGEQLPPVGEWIAQRNKSIRSGSRVACVYSDMADRAPALKKRYGLKLVGNPACTHVATKEDREFYVSVETNESIEAKVWLREAQNDRYDSNYPGYLCIDDVKPAEIHRYVHSRLNRIDSISYLRLFRRIERALLLEAARFADSMAYLRTTVVEHAVCTDVAADEMLCEAVKVWRAARRGADLPAFDDKKTLSEILTLVYGAAQLGDSHEAMIDNFLIKALSSDGAAYEPLLLTRTGKNKLALYVVCPMADRAGYAPIVQFRWIKRITLTALKTKVTEVSSSLAWLIGDGVPSSETMLRSWTGLETWINAAAPAISLKDLKAARLAIDGSQVASAEDASSTDASKDAQASTASFVTWLKTEAGLGNGIPDTLFRRLMAGMRTATKDRLGAYDHRAFGLMVLPVAAYANEPAKDGSRTISHVCMTTWVESFLWHFGNPTQSEAVKQAVCAYPYRKGDFAAIAKHVPEWKLRVSNQSHAAFAVANAAALYSDDSWMKIQSHTAGGLSKKDLSEAFGSHNERCKTRVGRSKSGPFTRSDKHRISLERSVQAMMGNLVGQNKLTAKKWNKDKRGSSGMWARRDADTPEKKAALYAKIEAGWPGLARQVYASTLIWDASNVARPARPVAESFQKPMWMATRALRGDAE